MHNISNQPQSLQIAGENRSTKGVPLNLNINIAKDRQQQSYQQYYISPQGTPLEDKQHQISKGIKSIQQQIQVSNNRYAFNTEENSPLKISDCGIIAKNFHNHSNNSLGSDLLSKQNSNNSSDKINADKLSSVKKNLSKFNYQGNDSPLILSKPKVARPSLGANPYLFASSDLSNEQINNGEFLNRKKEISMSKLQTQPNEPLSSSKQATKNYFFQKCVSEINSPLKVFPNGKDVPSFQYGQVKQIQNNGNNKNSTVSNQMRRRSKVKNQQGGLSMDAINFSNINSNQQNINYFNGINNNSNNQQIEFSLPKLENIKFNSCVNPKTNNYRNSLNLTVKQIKEIKDKSLNSFNAFDDFLQENQHNKFGATFMKGDNRHSKVSQSMNNLSFGIQDRQSINHQHYQQQQKMQKQKEREEYFQEEVAKVKNLWHQYEHQRVQHKEIQQLRQKTEGSPSPLKYQRDEMLKDKTQKMKESKKQEFFNEMISSVKLSAISTMGQSTSVAQSPKENLTTFIISPRNFQPTLNSIPADLLYSKEDQIKSSQNEFNKNSNDYLDQSKQMQNNPINQATQSPSRLQTLQTYVAFGSEMNDLNDEGLWEGSHIWENIVKDAFEVIKKEKIIISQEFNYQLLLDFLNNVVGRNYKNNEKYLRESLKLIGLTPEVSEIVCDRISRLMSEKYGIKNKQINKFITLYNEYEKSYLTWNLIDRMGGKGRIEEVISTYIQLVNTNPSISSALRLLNISNDLIEVAFHQLLSMEERRHKQYFRSVQNFFKQPLYRISHTKFFYTAKFYLERSLQKNKIQPQYKNRIYLLIEQMRYFVTLPLPQDALYLLPQSNNTSEKAASSPDQNIKSDDQPSSSAKIEEKLEEVQEEHGLVPHFCQQIGAILRAELMGMIKVKQAIIKHSSISLNNKNIFEQYIVQLVQIFALNNNDSIAYFDLLNNQKFRTIILLTDDFYQIFSKLLMENLVKNLHLSIYFSKDTHKRLQHVKILINRLHNNFNSRKLGEINYNVTANIQTNYLNGGCFFNELFNHPNPIEFILDKLDDIYHYKSDLNKLCPFSKVQRSRALCRYILCYFYPFVDQNGYSEFVSAFDFQCYVSLKKLKQEFFVEFRRVLKDLFINQFNFPVSLVSRLTQEYSYALHGIELFSIGENGSGNLYEIRKKAKSQQKTHYDDEFDDEKQEF